MPTRYDAAQAGHQTAAITRPSYPVTIGRLSQAPVEVVDGVRIHPGRALEAVSHAIERLSEQADRIATEAHERGIEILHTTMHDVNGLLSLERRRQQRTCRGSTKFAVRPGRDMGGCRRQSAEARSARRDSQRFALMRAKEIEVASAADAVITLGETMREHLIAGSAGGNHHTHSEFGLRSRRRH